MKKLTIILSTGIGPLHFMKSAVYLSKLVNIKVIQSWIPQNTDGLFVKLLSKLVGHKHLATGLKKRTPKEIEGQNYSVAFPDFFLWGLNVFSHCFGFPSKKKIAGWGWYFYGKQSQKYISNAQIFHVRSGAGQGGAIKKAKREGMRVIVDHSIAHPGYMEKYLRGEYQRNKTEFNLGLDSPLFRYTIRDAMMADCLVVNSDFVKKTFVDEGYPADKIKVAYLGVRDDFMGLKNNYHKGQKLKLLFTGGFGFRKGAEYLLKALQILEAEKFPYEMKVVGNYSEAKDLIEKYPVKNVEFVGFVPQTQLKTYLKEADIYVFPSLCEGCASSGMEALAAGLPVIATEESGFPITHGINGWIITSKDELALVSAIKELNFNETLAKQLGENAVSMMKTEYTWAQYANSVKNVYIELLSTT